MSNNLSLFPDFKPPEPKKRKKFPKCVIDFNFDDCTWEGIGVEQVQEWERTFPSVDVVHELTKKMPTWLRANPNKANSYKHWGAFIVNWLTRAQERYEQFKGRT